MPWVTFGYVRAAGMAVTVRANSKDENCFAQAASRTQAGLHELAPPKGGNGRANRKKGRPVRLFHGLKGSDFPLDIRRDGRGSGYCFLPVKVPSPNCPSDTLPFMVLPSVLPEYFTARG